MRLTARTRWWATLVVGVVALGLVALGVGGFGPGGTVSDDGPPAAPPRTPSASPYDGEGLSRLPPTVPSLRPNLIVLVIDALRADAVERGLSGEPPLMPFLASLAEQGVRFTEAAASSSWTKPSLASLLTGLLPSEHGAVGLADPTRLPQAVTTFAEVLARTYGYETAAFVDSAWYGGPSALLQGFEHVAPYFGLQASDAALTGWARRRDPSRPVFLLLHTLEAHEPYGPRNHAYRADGAWDRPAEAFRRAAELTEPWEMARAFLLDLDVRLALRETREESVAETVAHYRTYGYAADPRPDLAAELRTAYQEGVRWIDGNLARTVALLERSGLLEDAVLVVTADHGESFGEHGVLGHGHTLYDEVLRVPLVMKGPTPLDGGRTVAASMGLIDVLPTFFDLAGVAPVSPTSGRSALPLVRGEARGWPVRSEVSIRRDASSRPVAIERRSVRSERWKHVATYDLDAGTRVEELYDLERDPAETRNLLAPEALPGPDLPDDFLAAVRASRLPAPPPAR